jgi:hypothetical protein
MRSSLAEPGTEPGTSGPVARNSDHWTTEAITSPREGKSNYQTDGWLSNRYILHGVTIRPGEGGRGVQTLIFRFGPPCFQVTILLQNHILSQAREPRPRMPYFPPKWPCLSSGYYRTTYYQAREPRPRMPCFPPKRPCLSSGYHPTELRDPRPNGRI